MSNEPISQEEQDRSLIIACLQSDNIDWEHGEANITENVVSVEGWDKHKKYLCRIVVPRPRFLYQDHTCTLFLLPASGKQEDDSRVAAVCHAGAYLQDLFRKRYDPIMAATVRKGHEEVRRKRSRNFNIVKSIIEGTEDN